MVSAVSRLRWVLLTLVVLGGLLSVSAQDEPLTLPNSVPQLEPTPGTLPEGEEWRGFNDPSTDSLGLPTEQTGETREWTGPRAPSAADDVPVNSVRSPAGSDSTEAFDFVGANLWHRAGYTGGGTTPIKIALIDFGFGTSESIPNARKPELTCLSTYPTVSFPSGYGAPAAGDTGRGLDMAEVICDLAPDAKITLYKVKTYQKLYDAIAVADNTHDIIVIGTDFGSSFSPGDGTFGRSDAKNVYTALAEAKNAGAVVIVAAGNANLSYKSFTYTGGSSQLTITAKPGDTVDISWNDWDTHQAGGATREDISASLVGNGFAVQAKPARGSGQPGYQWTIPSCTTDGNGNCTGLNLTLSSLTGDAGSVVVQVSVSGIGRALSNPTAGTVLSFSGTLSRPADSPDVITVGAVCADRNNGFPPVGYTGNGPVFAAGGAAPSFPGGLFLTANHVKPEVSSFAQVSVTNNSVSDLTACNQGFSGTQAAAAHLAGIVALLSNNPLNSAFRGTLPQPNILAYLRTHAIDLPIVNPDGFDYEAGAGVSVLGSATYDNDAQFGTIPLFVTPDKIPSGACTGADANIDSGDILYVGPYNVGSAGMNGTLSAPLNSLALAAKTQAQDASGNKCVIVLPGETVTPFYFNHANGVKIFGYNSITTGNFDLSEVFVNNVANGRVDANFRIRRAGIVVEDMSNWYWSGFTFRGTESLNSGLQPRPQAVALDNADNATFSNNILNGFPTLEAVTLVEIFNGSAPVLVEGNSFLDINGSSMPGVLVVEDSGTASNKVVIANNLFDSIDNASGAWAFVKNPNSADGSVLTFFTPIMHTLDSYTNIQSNTFSNNSSKTLIQFMTRTISSPHQTAIIGNVILNNTIQTLDPLDNSGPLINGFFSPRVYILNNTIVKNTITSIGDYALMFGRGDADPDDTINGIEWNGSLNSNEARWEIHNNFIYNNGSIALAGDTDPSYSGSGCTNFAGTVNAGVSYNWLYNLNGAMNYGECSTAANNAGNNNIISLNPYPIVDGIPVAGQTYIFGGDDSTAPQYYTLTGNAGNPTDDGVDEGLDSLVISEFASFASGRDARNAARRRDGDADTSILIDIGAFELGGPGLSFTLTTPANDAVLTSVSAGFTWTPAIGAVNYTFDLKRLEGNSPINLLTLTGLTAAADADGLTCTVGCLFTLTAEQQGLLTNGGVFRWAVLANDGASESLAANAPRRFSIPTGTLLPLLNNGFELQGSKPKVALNWKSANPQGDDIRKCGAGFGANGSNCSFQLKTKAGAKISMIKQKLVAPGIGEGGDILTLSAYVRRKGLVANTAIIKAKISYTTKKFVILKVTLPAGGTDTWEATPYSNSIILTSAPISIMTSASIKGNRGMYWVDDIQLVLD